MTDSNLKSTGEALLTAITVALVLGLTGCLEEEPASGDDPPVDGEPLVLACGAEGLYSYEHDRCEAMDAVGDGACYCAIGFAWDGEGCQMITGCECVGDDCDSLAQTEEQCLAAHSGCSDEGGLACGSEGLHSADHESCGAMDARAEGECYCHLGFAWNGSGCESLGGCECVGEDCDALTTSEEDCLAAHEGCSEVDDRDLSCGSPLLYSFEHDRCEAMDAVGDGACYCMIGLVWDGEGCQMITGCECVGDDCDSLAQTEEQCLAAHSGC